MISRGARIALAALLVALATPSVAVQPDEVLRDPALERRAREISGGLRCLVCQNQSIDESDAPLARDLRLLVRDRIKAGDSDAQVRTFVVSRYGDFVLLRPPFAAKTLLLWLAPALVLATGALGLFLAVRRRRSAATAPAALSPDEARALDEILERDRG